MAEIIGEGGEVRVAPFVRSAYNYDVELASMEAGLVCEDASRTQQQFAEEVDINTIVKRFGLTGELPSNVAVPQSADFAEVMDFHGAMNVIRKAEEAFMEMPAEVRTRFGNDPGEFMKFVHDEKNIDEAIKLGIALPKPAAPPPPEPMAVRIVEAAPK